MLERFVPEDCRIALGAGRSIPPTCSGTAVFCDIVGFSAVSTSLLIQHGRRKGAEVLQRTLEATLSEAVAAAQRRGGFPLAFAGDALTLWFDAPRLEGEAMAAAQAASCALDLAAGRDRTGPRLRLSLASGTCDRLTLGDPAYGWLDFLGGEASARLAALDRLAAADRIVICAATADRLRGLGARAVPLPGDEAWLLSGIDAPGPATPSSLPGLDPALALGWVPRRLRSAVSALGAKWGEGGGDPLPLAEIRPIAAVFVLIADANLAGASDLTDRARAFLRKLQRRLHDIGGMVLNLNADAKGAYVSCVFGAPTAHEDDAERALSAALAALALGSRHGLDLRVGVARGTGLAGLIAAGGHLRYDVMSAAMTRAARLMTQAPPGGALTTSDLAERAKDRFSFSEGGAMGEGAVAEEDRAWRIDGTRPLARVASGAAGLPGSLIGRGEVMARLAVPSEAGQGALFVIEAPRGLGKSAVLAQLRRSEEAAGRLWLQGVGDNRVRSLAYLAWGPALRSILGRADDLGLEPDTIGILAWAAGEAGRLPETLRGLSGGERALRVGAALVAALGRLGALQPVTLAFDDLHWMDTPSVGLLLAVAGAGLPIRTVVTRRPGPAASMEAGLLLGHPQAATLALDPLGPEAVLDLARHALRAETLSYDLGRLFLDKTSGSPLLVTLVAQVLTERRLVRTEAGHCVVAPDATSPGRLDFLESEEAAILARFDEMPERRKRVARAASLLGRSFSVEELDAALAGTVEPRHIAEDLRALVRSGYLTPRTDQGATGFVFRQPLVHAAIHESMAFAHRAPINRRLAEFWAARSDPEALPRRAWHLLGSMNDEERDPARLTAAISALRAAASQAANSSANVEAGGLWEEAVALAQRLPDGPESSRLRLDLQTSLAFGMAILRGYGDPSVERVYRKALLLADEVAASENLAYTIYGIFSFYAARGDYADAMRIARRIHGLSLRLREPSVNSLSHHTRAIIAVLRGRAVTSARLASRSIADMENMERRPFLEEMGLGDFRPFSGSWLGLSMAVLGRRPEAETAFALALEMAAADAYPRNFILSFCPLPVLADDPDKALPYAEHLVAEADARGFALFAVVGRIYLGWAAARLGHDDLRVRTFLGSQLQVAQVMGLGSFLPWFQVLAADAHLARGEPRMAIEVLDAAWAIIQRSGGSLFAGEVQRLRARVAEAQGDLTTAARCLDRAIRLGRGLPLFAQRAEAARIVLDAPEPAILGLRREPPVPRCASPVIDHRAMSPDSSASTQ